MGHAGLNGLIMLLCCQCNTSTPIAIKIHFLLSHILEEKTIDEVAVKDLSEREADAPIFSKLHLGYRKAVAFKEEFGRKVPKKRPCSPSAVKPTMAVSESLTIVSRDFWDRMLFIGKGFFQYNNSVVQPYYFLR